MLVHPAIAESDRAALGAATSCPAADDGSAVAAVVDAVIGAWLAQQAVVPESTADSSALVAIAVDGKAVLGATDIEGNQVHLLAAATHESSLVLGQVEAAAASPPAPVTDDSEPMRVAVAATNGASEPH